MRKAIEAFRALVPGQKATRIVEAALLVAVLWLHFAALSYAFTSRKYNFLDFKCYFVATVNIDYHTSPYYHAGGDYPFVYAPTTVYFFKLFSIYHFHEAGQQWFLVKCLLLFLLATVWTRFLGLRLGLKQALLLACGFTFAIVQDLVTGNVSIVEQALLWGGFAALTRRRYGIFGLCIVLASQFKLTLLVFLPFLFLIEGDTVERRRQWVALAGALGAFGATILLDFLIWHAWYRDMTANLAQIDYNGANCDPASRAFLEDLVTAVMGARNPALLHSVVLALYLLFGAIVLAVSGRALWRHRRKHGRFEPIVTILFACVVYALVLPRLKLYSYILVLPPAMYFAARIRSGLAAALFWLCLVPTRNLVYPLPSLPTAIARAYDFAHIPALVSVYTSLFALFGLWVWFLAELRHCAASEYIGPVLASCERVSAPPVTETPPGV